jgi:hypothetical protein
MRLPSLMQAFDSHAVYVATRSQSGISDNAHQPFCRSAIDDGYSRFPKGATERSRSIRELLGCAVIRTAENGNCVD